MSATVDTDQGKIERAVAARSRIIEELLNDADPVEAKRVLKIVEEFTQGFEFLRTVDMAVSFFGSARCTLGEDLYEEARELAKRLSLGGYAIVTGGGSGVMQAANHGAFDAKGRSIGFNIRLEKGQPLNPYTTESITFAHFFSRKVMLAYASEAYVFFPGGFGTFDELTEMITLTQTKKVKPVPIVLVNREYWTPFLEFVEKQLFEKYHTIDKGDMNLYHLVDSVGDAYDLITKLVHLNGSNPEAR